MTHRVGPKGQVVIPKQQRDRLGLEPGDDVVFQDVDEGVIVRRTAPLEELRGMCRLQGSALADWQAVKAADRQAEQRREDALGTAPPPDAR